MTIDACIEVLPAPRTARGFILSTFADSLQSNATQDVRGAVHGLERLINGGLGGITVARARGASEELLGWAAVDCGVLVYAYVIRDARRLGIGAHIVASVLDSVPVRLRHWSRHATAIAEHGWPLIYSPVEHHRRNAA